MGFMDEYNELKKKRKKDEKSGQSSGGSFLDEYNNLKAQREATEVAEIAPVFSATPNNAKADNKSDRKWFQSGLFEDGWQFGDVTKTILGTGADVWEELQEGLINIGEGVVDTGAYILGTVGGAFGADGFKDDMQDFIKKDLYDAEKVVKSASLADPILNVFGTDVEGASLLGERADDTVASGGHLLGMVALQAVGVPWQVTMGATSFGGEAENALSQGASMEESGLSAAITAGAEILTSYISGGISFGANTLDDALTKQISRNISNKVVRTATKLGIDMAGEGGEEILSGLISAVGQKLTYADDKELNELFSSEDAWEAFVGGAVLGGFGSGVQAVKSEKAGKDAVTGLTKNEQAVVDKVYKDAIANEEQSGKKLTEKEKAKIYDEVLNDLEKGYISTDTIAEALGGESYEAYKNYMDGANALAEEQKKLQAEFYELGKKQNATLADQARYNELGQQLKDIQTKIDDPQSRGHRDFLKAQMDKNFYELTKNDKLRESYFERVRAEQAFEADLSQYEGKAKDVIKQVMESGLVDNTNKSHEFWNMVAKMASDKNTSISVANNEQILEMVKAEYEAKGVEFDASQFAGKIIDGYVSDKGIVLNAQSDRSMNFIVGHEITHTLEGTSQYSELQRILFEYAKDEYQSRFNERKGQYSGIYADDYKAKIDKEITADMVGDFLFTDKDFIQHLSTKNRNVFQKIWDEIKYLYKMATAGSKEARELEKVKKAFEKAYRESGEAQGDTKYSISDSDGKKLTKEQQEYFKNSKMRDENGNLKVMYHGSQDAGFHVFDARMSDDDTSFFFVDRNDVAASYSGTSETYEAQTIRNAEDANKFIESIGVEGYEVVEQDGKFILLYEGDRVADSDSPQGIYEEFCWYEGVGEGDANYKVYLNLTNPLVVDAEGRNWDNVTREFSQELADKYNSLTADEKAALSNLASWEDVGIFRDEIRQALADTETGVPGTYDEAFAKNVRSAYEKLGGNKVNMYDLFSIAEDNFSDLSIEAWAVKQMNTRDYAQKAKAEGYDGVIFKNIVDIGQYGGTRTPATVAIAFNSNQIKSTANAKPTGDADIRYSLSDSNGRELSKEQADYFKDSKIRDANGNLKVMHHGSTEAFTVFDKKKAKASGYYGKGFYFTDSESHAKQYGNTYDVYLNITNPLQGGTKDITKDQIRKFVEAVAENEDYGIENYGYGATVDSVTDSVYGKSDFAMLMDINASCVGNMVEAIELFNEVNGTNYNGIIAATETVAFYPEQIKRTDNIYPTADTDIRYSLSDSQGRKLSKEQADYFKDSKIRDTDGKLIPMYHGTMHGGFTVFGKKDYWYFTNDKKYAYTFEGRKANGQFYPNTKEGIEKGYYNPQRYEVYLDVKNPFVTDDIGIIEDALYWDRTLAGKLREKGYDALMLEDMSQVIVLNQNQIKNVSNKKPSADPDIRYSLTEDNEGRKLSDSQSAYFSGSKVTDENGKLKVVYHGSGAEFTEFSYRYMSTHGSMEGQGFYFTDNKTMAEGYQKNGTKLMQGYLDIKKPLSDSEVTMKRSELTKLLKAVDPTGDDVVINYDPMGGVGYPSRAWYNRSLAATVDAIYRSSVSDSEILADLANSGAGTETVVRKAREILGYDGYIVGDKYDDTTIYVAFESNQFKNIDNLNPTSDPDIRRSISDIGQKHKTYGRWNVYGKDMLLDKGIAPVGVAENTTTNATTQQLTQQQHNNTTTNVTVSEMESIAPVAEKTSPAVLYSMRDGKNGWGKVYATAQEALNDAVQNANSELWDAFNEEIANTPQNTAMPRGSTPITNALIAVQEDVRQETITPMQGAQLLSEAYSNGGVNALKRMVNPKTGNLFDQHLEKAKLYETIAPVAISKKETTTEELFQDTPMQSLEELMAEAQDIMGAMEAYEAIGDRASVEQLLPEYESVMEKIGQLEEAERQRADSLLEADVPPEMDAPIYAKAEKPADPFRERDWDKVGNRKVKAYMYENPEVKPFFQEAAGIMLWDLSDTIKAEKWYNDKVYYDSGGEKGFGGNKRYTSDDIAYLLDSCGFSYADIEKGLNAIIEDNGAENIAAAKRIEFILNNRLMNGYKDFHTGKMVPPNQDYLNLLKEKQISEYSKEAFDYLVAHADEYAPPVTDDVAPVRNVAQKPVVDAGNLAPTVEVNTSKGGEVKGQQALYKEAIRNESDKTAKILIGQEHGQKKKQSGLKWADEHIFRHGAVFEDLALATGNRELQARFDNIRRAESRAQSLIGKGNGYVGALLDVKKSVDDAGKTKAFNEYLYHMLNVDRMTLEDRFKDTPNKPVYGDTVTAEVSRKAAAKLLNENPEFQQYAEELYGINKYLREMMVDEGIISRETADLWQAMYPHYVPIGRVGHEGLNVNVPLDTNKTGVNAPIKRATGGNSDIYDAFETMGSRISQTYKAIAKNRFGVELKNTLGTVIENEAAGGVDEVLDSVDAHEELLQEGKKGQKPTFTVFENGERVKFEITDEMYEAMKPSQFTYTNKVANAVGNARRDILTTYSHTFAVTNPIKDIGDILVNSQHPVRTYATIPEAIKSVIKKDHWYQERMEHGGDQDTYFDSQTKTYKKEPGKFGKAVGFPFEKIRQVNEAIEQIPRMAEYIASRRMGRSIDVSMLDAARVTTNFGAAGDFTNMLNRNGFTFLGASVEGFNQQVRNVREAKAEGLKGWGKLAGKYIAAGLPALLLNHLLWDDDEEYEELSDYVKQNYYVVAKFGDGKFLRIPKGRAVAVIQDAFQQMENLITGNDEVDLESFGQLVLNNLAPNNPLDNNIISPLVQTMVTEKTWYGDDLVPTRLQDMPAAEQYDETTDAISKWIGEKLNISPYKLNYLLDQYSGGVGDIGLPYLTPQADGGGFGAAFRDKFVTDSTMKNQNVTDFYDKMDELAVNANSAHATDEDILMSKYMNAVNSEMSELYKQKREIQNSGLSDKDKNAQLRKIQQQIVDLAKEGLDRYGDINYESDGEYAVIGGKYFQWYEPEEGDPYWRKLSEAQTVKYELTKNAGDAYYVTDGNVHYRRDQSGEWTKISDKQLERMEEVTEALGITPDEYWSKTDISFLPMSDGEYEYAFDNPGNYAVAKAVGGYDAYKGYSKDLYEIKADKDENGKSISGSRKEKVIDYINGLDADYGEKIILLKSQYPADDTYNYEIIDYLNGREDISYEEMETILKELGFNVSSDGYITWD